MIRLENGLTASGGSGLFWNKLTTDTGLTGDKTGLFNLATTATIKAGNGSNNGFVVKSGSKLVFDGS
jgi:hypothetical protein